MVPVLALPFQAHCLRPSWQMFRTPDGPWDLHNSPDGNHVFETISSSLQARCRALKSLCTPRSHHVHTTCTPVHHVHTGEGPGSPGSSVFLIACVCVCVRGVCVCVCVCVCVSVHADLECTLRTLIIVPPPTNRPPYQILPHMPHATGRLTGGNPDRPGPQADRRKLSPHIRLPCEDCGPRALVSKATTANGPRML
jgi:hypothetical protein